MRVYAQLGLAILAVLLLIFYFEEADETWDVILPGLPVEVTTHFAHSLSTAYILKQTHEPLFRRDANQSYFSNVLDHWTRTIDSKQFDLCIHKPKMFNASRSFGALELEAHLRQRLQAQKINFASIQRQGECVRLLFADSEPRFLYLFSLLRNAPTIESGDARFEHGLGPYLLYDFGAHAIRLHRKNKAMRGYNELIFWDLERLQSPASLTQIEDFNLLPLDRIPFVVKANYSAHLLVQLKISVLLLNIKNQQVRARIADCVNVDALRRALYGQNEFIDIRSIVPLGVPGARAGKIAAKCTAPSPSDAKALRFLTWHSDREEKVRAVLAEVSRLSGISIEPYFHSYAELSAIVYSKSKPFDLLAIKIDTKDRTAVEFFEGFFDEERGLLSYRLDGPREEYDRLKRIDGIETDLRAVNRLQDFLLDSHFVVPLFQDVRSYYYPTQIQNLFVGEDYSNYPDISRIRRSWR